MCNNRVGYVAKVAGGGRVLKRRGGKTKVHGIVKEDEAARLEREGLAPINVQYRKTLPPNILGKHLENALCSIQSVPQIYDAPRNIGEKYHHAHCSLVQFCSPSQK